MTPCLVHVIDDDEAARDSLEFLLCAFGFEVRTYASADAFLDVAGAASAGCVISDIRMPGTDGVQLAARLQQLRPDLPVVLVTGHGDLILEADALAAGAIRLMEKPYGEALLMRVVGKAMGRGE